LVVGSKEEEEEEEEEEEKRESTFNKCKPAEFNLLDVLIVNY